MEGIPENWFPCCITQEFVCKLADRTILRNETRRARRLILSVWSPFPMCDAGIYTSESAPFAYGFRAVYKPCLHSSTHKCRHMSAVTDLVFRLQSITSFTSLTAEFVPQTRREQLQSIVAAEWSTEGLQGQASCSVLQRPQEKQNRPRDSSQLP